METGATVLPHFFRDNTDRNRTSPFAFTGNKFEFRSLGSSLSVAGPNVVLNTAVAESLRQFYEVLADAEGEDLEVKVRELLKKTIKDHKRVIFNGDGYTDEWVAEAEARGLENMKSTPDALPCFIRPKNIELFTRHGIFTESEIYSRYEIFADSYVKTINIEARTLLSMLSHEFLPALRKYAMSLADTLTRKKELLGEGHYAEITQLKEITEDYNSISEKLYALKADMESAPVDKDSLAQAVYCHDVILKKMEEIREVADRAETVLPKETLPYPTYEELLFTI
jgi:glutamine synthetase